MPMVDEKAVLVIGATGLVGSALCAKLVAEGFHVIAATHRSGRPAPDRVTHIRIDMAQMSHPDHWLPLLKNVDAVVNCAGILQDGGGESVRAVHQNGPAALFAACERAGVTRVIHLSAIGVDREQPTPFSRSKAAGDAALINGGLDWVILRPSVITGRQAYGGSALFRGLASLPFSLALPEAGRLQVVQLDDVVRTILFFLQQGAPSRIALELAGPDRLSFEEVVAAYRSWYGWPPARTIKLPRWFMRLSYAAGDFAGWLGWRPPIRTTAALEMTRGAVGDPARWIQMTGIQPRSLRSALAREPASVQERWFARLYLLKPLILVVLALFWIGTAIMALAPGWSLGLSLMYEGGVSEPLASRMVVAGALADLVIGIGIAVRRTSRTALHAGIWISLVYAVMGTWLVPRLWIDPLGPMLKIWPVLMLNVVALAVLEDR
jgi:uncharacterized protein YbjT (DUF2867 family)